MRMELVLLNNNDNGGGNPENPDPRGGDPGGQVMVITVEEILETEEVV